MVMRVFNQVLQRNAKRSPIAPHNADYVGKHESLVDSIAEIFAEVCSDLEITAEFIAETVAENAAHMRKIAEKYLRKIRIPMPEFRPARNFFPTGEGVVIHAGIV